ncbi:hypothetical protein GCM10028808_64980 [Spirosoma migulaei]
MTFIKLFFVVALLPVQLAAQAITAQLQLNPIHIGQYIPISLGGGIEVGLSPKSSIQINGVYRVDKALGESFTKGPKAYLAYRYYINPEGQKNRGYYISPFVGYGSLQSYDYEASPDDEGKLIHEKYTGVLLGFQPYKCHRFTVDIYGGPDYQWRVENSRISNLLLHESHSDRLWLRAGFYVCFRLKK